MFATQEWNPRTPFDQVGVRLKTHSPHKLSHWETLYWYDIFEEASMFYNWAWQISERNHCGGSSSLHFFWKWRFAFLSNRLISGSLFGFQDAWVTFLFSNHRVLGTTFGFGLCSDQHAVKEIWWYSYWRRGRILDSFCPTLVHLGDGTGVQEHKIHTSTWRYY